MVVYLVWRICHDPYSHDCKFAEDFGQRRLLPQRGCHSENCLRECGGVRKRQKNVLGIGATFCYQPIVKISSSVRDMPPGTAPVLLAADSCVLCRRRETRFAASSTAEVVPTTRLPGRRRSSHGQSAHLAHRRSR